jgi:23S rRNA U2552 (ribose-2'-O)-methylase RlmE/FtsJ
VAVDAGATVAVDVGAAPGGWTKLLAACCDRVIAIDPGALHADVVALPAVTHVRKAVGGVDEANVGDTLGPPFVQGATPFIDIL